MLKELKDKTNLTLTENGAVTYKTTNSRCLDFFSTVGGMRFASERDIINSFIKAYTENPDTAMKLLFFARDVRGGLGERRVFRTILNWLAQNEPESVNKNIAYISEFGRYDDLLSLIDTKCQKNMINIIKTQLKTDLNSMEKNSEVSLLGKWLPSVNTSNKDTVYKAKKLAKCLGMTDKEYRQTLSSLRSYISIIENNLRTNDYTFDYSKQPSKAMVKYRKAFLINDQERYTEYLNDVTSGNKKINTSTLYPYELVRPYLGYSYNDSFMRDITEEEKNYLNTTWNNLPDYGNEENLLAIIDTSGSMYWNDGGLPACVAMSLGLYIAERNTGEFHNHFIEFSDDPTLIELKGETFADKLRYASTFNEIGSTNLEAVFKLILDTATENNIPQEEMPSKLIIISDMEFNETVKNPDKTNFKNAEIIFAENGYTLPDVVFWNVSSRNKNQPVKMYKSGVALVSGCSANIFEMVAGGVISPFVFMEEVLNKERYKCISA